MKKKTYYIGRRDNPQLGKPYYRAYGCISKADKKAAEATNYGALTMIGYDSVESFFAAIEKLKADGFQVNNAHNYKV